MTDGRHKKEIWRVVLGARGLDRDRSRGGDPGARFHIVPGASRLDAHVPSGDGVVFCCGFVARVHRPARQETVCVAFTSHLIGQVPLGKPKSSVLLF